MNITKRFFGSINIPGTWPNVALLLLRIYVGFTMMSAGLDKLPLPDWMTEQVAEMGFPFPEFFGWIASWSEFGCGLMLLLGFATRFSAFMIMFTMAVATFIAQGLLPFVDMHIAQHYVWSGFLFLILGGGKYALDRFVLVEGKKSILGYAGILAVLAIGLIIQFTGKPYEESVEDSPPINSVNIAGSFNNWDPASNEMTEMGDGVYELILKIQDAGPIQFKFTANKSWDLNIGEKGQESKGFPLMGVGELDTGGDTQNIQCYIPEEGNYIFEIDLDDYSYTVLAAKN